MRRSLGQGPYAETQPVLTGRTDQSNAHLYVELGHFYRWQVAQQVCQREATKYARINVRSPTVRSLTTNDNATGSLLRDALCGVAKTCAPLGSASGSRCRRAPPADARHCN